MKKFICGIAVSLSSCFAVAYGQTNVLNSTGNAGIGTTSPSQPLHVVGNTLLEGDVEMPGDRYIYSVLGNGTKPFIRFYNPNNTATSKLILKGGTTVEFGSDLSFTSGSGGMFDGQGQWVWLNYASGVNLVGINKPFGIHRAIYSKPASGAPNLFSDQNLEFSFSGNAVGGPFSYSVTRNNGSGVRTAILHSTATGDWTIGQAGTALRVTPDNTNGHVNVYPQSTLGDLFLNSESSGTGNTFLNANNAGFVGVGTSSPSQRLHVNGSLGVTGSIKGLETNGSLDVYAASYVHDGSYLQLFGKDHSSVPGQVWITSGYNANGSGSDDAIVFGTKQNDQSNNFVRNEHMVIHADGRVKIGAEPVPTGYKLAVEEGIITEKVKVAVAGTTDWSDYVFADDYKLMPLQDLRAYVAENKHLPGVPSAEEVVNQGLDLGKMDAKLLEKVEELTLYIIELEAKVNALQGK